MGNGIMFISTVDNKNFYKQSYYFVIYLENVQGNRMCFQLLAIGLQAVGLKQMVDYDKNWEGRSIE